MAKKLAVIGAGLMGSGIAQVSAAAGYEVVLRDVTETPPPRAGWPGSPPRTTSS